MQENAAVAFLGLKLISMSPVDGSFNFGITILSVYTEILINFVWKNIRSGFYKFSSKLCNLFSKQKLDTE